MKKVEVEDEIFEVLEARAEAKGFENTKKYIDNILEQVVEKIENEKGHDEEVKSRLKELGYID